MTGEIPTVTDLSKRVSDIIYKLKCIEEWRDVYYDPVLIKYPELETNEVELLWNLFRQAGTLCALVNLIQKGLVDKYTLLDISLEDPFNNPDSHNNIEHFLTVCRDVLFIFDAADIQVLTIYTNDVSSLMSYVTIVEDLITRLHIRSQADFTKKKKSKTRKDSDLPKKEAELNTITDETKRLRNEVCNEFFNTEKVYVNKLEYLQHYKNKLEESGAFSKENIYQIFRGLDAVVNFQRLFYLDMEAMFKNTPGPNKDLGSLFLKANKRPKNFDVYKEFCANHMNAMEIIHKFDAESKLTRYNNIINNNSLSSYLILPVQRICKYPLLLKEYRKKIKPDEPIFRTIRQGEELSKQIASYINEYSRKGENYAKAIMFKERATFLGDLNFDEFGPLRFQENLATINSEDVEREYSVYLFEHFVIICRDSSSGALYAFGRHTTDLTLTIVSTIKLQNLIEVLNVSVNYENAFAFKLVWRVKDGTGIVTLKFQSKGVFQQWFDLLTQVLKDKREQQRISKIAESIPPNLTDEDLHINTNTL